jgi:6-pyruvoyltetrahydropterin/6-carboxytetrahydropterin synthase
MLVFSAAHFITFQGDVCERLHGHNYRVEADVFGPLDDNSYVVDFVALRDALRTIIKQLDHYVLLPTQHPLIQVSQEGEEVHARFREQRWVFPRGDCVLLPVANTTAELLARYIGQQLKRRLQDQPGAANWRIRLAVDENFGQWGVWHEDL